MAEAQLKPVKTKRLRVLCDNERLLDTKDARQPYWANQAVLEHIPASPLGLNPVDKFWGWLRQRLLEQDLEDLNKRRDVPGKQQYKNRVLQICNSKAAKTVANNYLLGLRNVGRLRQRDFISPVRINVLLSLR